MIKVCEERLQRSATEEPLQMPEVPEELEAMMRATFHLFGLELFDDQKQQQQQEQEDPGRFSGLMEAVPPEQGQEPEPEPMDGQAEAAAMSGQATTKEWERAPISELCGSFEAATIAARTALAEAGTDFAHVVRVTYMLPDRDEFPPCWPLLRDAFGDNPPAATMIECGLITPQDRIEIEVTALAPAAA